MITVYGNNENLSMKIIEAYNSFLECNKDLENITIYFEYPYEPIDSSTPAFLKVLIVSKMGIFYVVENDTDKKIYRKVIKTTCLKIDSIADKEENGTKISSIINVDEFASLNLHQCSDEVLDLCEINAFNTKFQKADSLSIFDERIVTNNKTLGSFIKDRNNKTNQYDTTEFNSIYQHTIKSHLRIRGLAGSGKTIVLVKMMAYLHYVNPELKMCYTFFTISLKQYIQSLFVKFYKEFNPDIEYDKTKISFYHSWGSKKDVGFYSNICEATNNERETLDDNRVFNNVCMNLIKKLPPEKLGLFDYVFIDEAQDFPLGFFQLALKSLNTEGKLIYAYDELQSLYVTNRIPKKRAIFNDEECKDINLSVCYRTPKEIIVTAHALGMGIYSNGEMCNIPEDLSIWKAIGYETSNKIVYGNDTSLYRNPGRLDYISNEYELIEFKKFENKKEQNSELNKTLYKLISKEDVLPEDILIIDLDGTSLDENYYEFRNSLTSYLNRIASGSERAFKTNLVSKENAVRFKVKDSIPYTTIFRAKGNEANIVFVINTDKMAALSTVNRNRLFTAMTRAKMKVYVYGGNEIQKYIDEYEVVRDKNYKLDFKYPTKEELRLMQTTAENEDIEHKNITKAVELTKGIKDPKLMIEIMMAQTGCKTIEELQEYLNNVKE